MIKELSRRRALLLAGTAVLASVMASCRAQNREMPGRLIVDPTLKRSQLDAQGIDRTVSGNEQYRGLVFGQGVNVSCNDGASRWELMYGQPTQGQGFIESYGTLDLGSKDKVVTLHPYIHTNNKNGVYEGEGKVRCFNNNGQLLGELPLTYKITLTD